jgi:hypothetical protein
MSYRDRWGRERPKGCHLWFNVYIPAKVKDDKKKKDEAKANAVLLLTEDADKDVLP